MKMCLSVCLPSWENYQANFYCSSYELLGLVVYLGWDPEATNKWSKHDS